MSFCVNLPTVKSHPAAAFYMPHARLWELALGGILAQIDQSFRQSPQAMSVPAGHSRRQDVAAVAGLILLSGAFILLNSQRLFPGWLALIPVNGTLLLIAAGDRRGGRRVHSGSPDISICRAANSSDAVVAAYGDRIVRLPRPHRRRLIRRLPSSVRAAVRTSTSY